MAHYGDPEAHRCILEEISARPAAPHHIACLRAAVMGSQGSDVGLQQLCRLPGAVEHPGPLLEVTLSLLSMTICASAAKPSFRKEKQRVYEKLARKRALLVQQRERLKANCSENPLLWGASSGPATDTSVNLSSSDVSGTSSSVEAAAAAAGGVSSVLLGNGVEEDGVAAAAEEEGGAEEETLSPLKQWEQSWDILNYCEAYANYLSGFTVLWYELFGPHYYSFQHEGLLPDARDGEAVRQSRGAEPGEWASSTSPTSSPQEGPQVPPHLYAVCWSEILTPQRRAWFQGLHNVVKELLVRILCRELPLELYVLFILYANLSLRVYLLQTLAEVFEWTSHYLDVLCYVHVMRQSYTIQCEMSKLQHIWAAFGLFDNRFIEECRELNKMYTELQGAFSEQKLMVRQAQTQTQATGSDKGGAPAGPPPKRSGLSNLSFPQQTFSNRRRYHDSNEEAAAAARRSSSTLSSRSIPSAAVVNSATTTHSGDVVAPAVQRVFPLRAAATKASADTTANAEHSSASSSLDDEALSTASETAADNETRKTKRDVYLPLFYTCCCFTWILQRSFWSMYGRSSLLLESCLGNEVTQQALRAGAKNMVEGDGSSALLRSTSLGARRRGTAATDLNGADSSPAATSASVQAMSRVNSTRLLHTQTAATNGNYVDRRDRAATAGAASAPNQPSSIGVSFPLGAHLAGRPPQVPRAPLPPSQTPTPSHQYQQQHQNIQRTMTGTPPQSTAAAQMLSNPQGSAQQTILLVSSPGSSHLPSEAASPSATPCINSSGSGEQSATPSRWESLLRKLVPRRHQHRHSSAHAFEGNPQPNGESSVASSIAGISGFADTSSKIALTAPLHTTNEETPTTTIVSENAEECAAAVAAASVSLTCSGAPFFLQYTHRAREIELYEDPSVSCTSSGREADSDKLFFEEFHFLRGTGCYVLSHALRSLTCYPRYPATLLILTDNTRRPGRVSWCDHKFSVLSSVFDGDERRGITPWVLCAVIPHSRLSSDGAVRAQQEERLLQHVVFQVAGATRSRVSFCTANSIFYVLNGGKDVDGGRLYFALHLHVPRTANECGHVSAEEVMREESMWAFRELAELQCSWAMPCKCNEALRVAFQVGPVDDPTEEI